MLGLLCLAELLGMSLWFAASSVAPQLATRWGLDASRSAGLTTVVQLGFVAGTAIAALLNLADLLPARGLFAGSALLGAAVNALLLAVPGYRSALLCRFATGFFLAGVYPPAMKMISTWYKDGRGFAIGTIVGALTVGKATPYLVHGLGSLTMASVVLTTSLAAALGGALVLLWYRDGPHAFERR